MLTNTTFGGDNLKSYGFRFNSLVLVKMFGG